MHNMKSASVFDSDGSPPTKKKSRTFVLLSVGGDPYGNRTHVTAVKGPCLNRLTNGPRHGSGCRI